MQSPSIGTHLNGPKLRNACSGRGCGRHQGTDLGSSVSREDGTKRVSATRSRDELLLETLLTSTDDVAHGHEHGLLLLLLLELLLLELPDEPWIDLDPRTLRMVG